MSGENGKPEKRPQPECSVNLPVWSASNSPVSNRHKLEREDATKSGRLALSAVVAGMKASARNAFISISIGSSFYCAVV